MPRVWLRLLRLWLLLLRLWPERRRRPLQRRSRWLRGRRQWLQRRPLPLISVLKARSGCRRGNWSRSDAIITSKRDQKRLPHPKPPRSARRQHRTWWRHRSQPLPAPVLAKLRLPTYRLPTYRLPTYRLPTYRLPTYRPPTYQPPTERPPRPVRTPRPLRPPPPRQPPPAPSAYSAASASWPRPASTRPVPFRLKLASLRGCEPTPTWVPSSARCARRCAASAW